MIKFRSQPQNDVPRRRSSSDFVRTPASTEPTNQFRRNQTLSGIRKPETPEVSERTRMHNLAHRRRRVGALFLLVLIILVILGA
jgi:hypothetical protein